MSKEKANNAWHMIESDEWFELGDWYWFDSNDIATSGDIMRAISLAKGKNKTILCRVSLGGNVSVGKDDPLVKTADKRRIIWSADPGPILKRFCQYKLMKIADSLGCGNETANAIMERAFNLSEEQCEGSSLLKDISCPSWKRDKLVIAIREYISAESDVGFYAGAVSSIASCEVDSPSYMHQQKLAHDLFVSYSRIIAKRFFDKYESKGKQNGKRNLGIDSEQGSDRVCSFLNLRKQNNKRAVGFPCFGD